MRGLAGRAQHPARRCLLERFDADAALHVNALRQVFADRIHRRSADVVRVVVGPAAFCRHGRVADLGEPRGPVFDDVIGQERLQELLESGRAGGKKLRAVIETPLAGAPRRDSAARAAGLFEDADVMGFAERAGDVQTREPGADDGYAAHANSAIVASDRTASSVAAVRSAR